MKFIDKLILLIKDYIKYKLLIKKLILVPKSITPTKRPRVDVNYCIPYYDYPSDRTNAISFFKADIGFRPK
jgi:hypothetical protein